MRQVMFICLAIALATVTTILADTSQSLEFSIGVAFIGYSVASVLVLATVFGD